MKNKALTVLISFFAFAAPLTFLTYALSRNTPAVATNFTPHKDGWMKLMDGIYGQWCTEKNKCPDTKTFYENNWRMMVWCKERGCGDINASVIIYNGKIIVANASATGIANKGDYVILTFGSDTSGNARLVKFSATNGTTNSFPIVVGSK